MFGARSAHVWSAIRAQIARRADGARKSASAALTAKLEMKRRSLARSQSARRRLHRTLQEFPDRHRRPRKLAKNPVVFGQEPRRDLFEPREQRPFRLAAIRCQSSIIAGWRLCLTRRIGCDAAWRDRQRLARVCLDFRERALLRLLIAARQGALRRFRKLWCWGGRSRRPRAF